MILLTVVSIWILILLRLMKMKPYRDLSVFMDCPSCGEEIEIFCTNVDTGYAITECSNCYATITAEMKFDLRISDVIEYEPDRED